jgi:hypothetical protein
MDEINVNVNDTPYVKSNTINNIKIRIMSVELFNSISICASLFENNNLLDNKIFKIEGEEYKDWGNDDTYIIDLILSKLGMTKS